MINRVDSKKLKEQAELLERVFCDRGLSLSRQSSLGKMISAAHSLARKPPSGTSTTKDWEDFFFSMHFFRIVTNLFSLSDFPDIDRYYVLLGTGSLDLLARTQSQAKDIYWELELVALLRNRGLAVQLEGPPDIVWQWDGLRVGIACKKLYSDKNVSKVLSQAVRQVERYSDFGIAAFNLDDLLPENKVFRSIDRDGTLRLVERANMHFLEKHHHRFLSYFAGARLISVLASCNVVADIANSRPQFLNVSDRILFNTRIDALSKRQMAALSEFRRLVEEPE